MKTFDWKKYEYQYKTKKKLVINGKRFICFSSTSDDLQNDLKSFRVY